MNTTSTSGSKALSLPFAATISILAHLLFLGCLFFCPKSEPEPEMLKVNLLSEIALPEPIATQTQPPAPEPPAPEPPAPEPPAPEPPAPEPPAPEPPAPEPPKPKPEPPKPKPEPPKPKPEPPKPKTTAPSLQERLRAAQVKTVQPQPRTQTTATRSSNPDEIRRRLTKDVATQRTSATALPTSGGTAAQRIAAAEAVDYAGRVLNPVVDPLWNKHGPNKGELGNVLPSPVELELVVLENGQIISVSMRKRSNLAAMNQAAEKLMDELRSLRLTSLPAAGIKSKRLEILLTLTTSAN
ncbi:MAG: hypothetical protein GX946_06730 [Oligosphaeraceae bacterium]|nr:hypothetical protein [Oligosphaeraceae bacterium]